MRKLQEAKKVLIKIEPMQEPRLQWIRCDFSFAYPRILYLLGRVYDQLDDHTEAIKTYKQLFEIWKNADADLPEFIDLKNRLMQ